MENLGQWLKEDQLYPGVVSLVPFGVHRYFMSLFGFSSYAYCLQVWNWRDVSFRCFDIYRHENPRPLGLLDLSALMGAAVLISCDRIERSACRIGVVPIVTAVTCEPKRAVLNPCPSCPMAHSATRLPTPG